MWYGHQAHMHESVDSHMHTDSGTVKVLLGVFRELCGLLWFLHVRDQFSAHLRQLQPSPLKVSFNTL